MVNILERFAYYGLLCNYILYLNKQPFYWESYNASLISFIFLGLTHTFSVVGGWIADSFLGRYTTICLGFLIYIIGYVAYPLMSYNDDSIPSFCHYDANYSYVDIFVIGSNTSVIVPFANKTIAQEPCSWLVFVSIIMISLAVGFIKSNIGPFGGDQVMSKGSEMVFKYFNWLYWSINLGSLGALGGLAYIQQNYSFFIGYTIPLGCLILAFILFLTGITELGLGSSVKL